MPMVRFLEKTPGNDGLAPAQGAFSFTPTRPRVDPATSPPTEVLPRPFTAALDATGSLSVDLAPTGAGWVWRVDRAVYGVPGETVYVAVPDTPGPLDWTALTRVDPATLNPAPAPVPAYPVVTIAPDGATYTITTP